jgi:hypothetical protein
MLAMKERAKFTVSKKPRSRSEAFPRFEQNVQEASARVSDSYNDGAIPLAVTGSEGPAKPHYVLTPAAGTEDEGQTVASSASGQTKIGPLSGTQAWGEPVFQARAVSRSLPQLQVR